jgi:hypothetical protein
MSQAPAPSIPHSPTPGKDPPSMAQPASVSADNVAEDADRRESVDSRAMPPPPRPNATSNPRRRSHQEGASPSSPAVLLTHPTFPSSSFPGDTQSQTQGHGQNSHNSQNTQQSLLGEGEGLAGTEGTVKGLGGAGAARPNFAPFFTLVNDLGPAGGVGTGSGEGKMAHPARVHYIFEGDEENGLLTDALVRCIDQQAGPGRNEGKGAAGRDREERVIIIDVNETGDAVRSVWSANPRWAVLSAEIGNAPTWEGEENTEEGEGRGRGLMLRIEGLSAASDGDVEDVGKGKRESEGSRDGTGSLMGSGMGSGIIGEEEMQGLLESFDRKMAVLRRIVSSGEEFRKAKNTQMGPGQTQDSNQPKEFTQGADEG